MERHGNLVCLLANFCLFSYLIATQFETLYFREMCPSVDDPHFKSTIRLTVIYPKGAKIFSNSYPEKEGDFK